MNRPLSNIRTRNVPQSQPARGDQVVNSTGGHVFQVNDRQVVRRFLILGTEQGSYYASPRELTRQAAEQVLEICHDDPAMVLEQVLDVSTRGLAPRQSPTLFTLAALTAVPAPGRGGMLPAVAEAVPRVVRTFSHLYEWLGYVGQFRGTGGRAMKRVVSDLFLDREPADVAFQAVKYRQRHGWTARDVLRVAHPKIRTTPKMRNARARDMNSVLRYITQGDRSNVGVIPAFEAVRRGELSPVDGVHRGLSWEMLPSEALTDAATWRALLARGMPPGALLRNLATMTRAGTFRDPAMAGSVRALLEPDRLQRSRVHPMQVLVALRIYASGGGWRSSNTWEPVPAISRILDDAFYGAFQAVEPTGKRLLLAVDISGSMSQRSTIEALSCHEAAAAMALTTYVTEPNAKIYGFCSTGTPRAGLGWGSRTMTGISELDLNGRRLDDVVAYMNRLPMTGTDCALPMLHALEHRIPVDTFVVLTDNETWAGRVHPFQALQQYRAQMGIPARLVVAAFTATPFTIADPRDAGMLDVVGLDASLPGVIAGFARGDA